MLAAFIAVFFFFLGALLSVAGTAIFHRESGAQNKDFNTLVISAIMMVFGMTFVGLSALIVGQIWVNDPYNGAAAMGVACLVIAWGVGVIIMCIFGCEAGVLLYHGRTHDEQKLINQRAQAAKNR